MPSDFFLGQTAAEWEHPLPPGTKKAWMACHFSPYGTGLSNLPRQMPPGSMVILNDRTPVAGHDPALIARQLTELIHQFDCSRILLDFQRPGEAQTQTIVKAILASTDCPVGVSHWYATDLDCPVFLPPLPLHMPLRSHIAPWAGRKIWLELAPDCARYTVTKDGCRQESCEATGEFPHFDQALHCRYRTEVSSEAITFTLCRTHDDVRCMLEAEEIDCFAGLYQEFSQPEAQATALAQCARRSLRTASEISGTN